MFCGVGPFVVATARETHNRVVGIELNEISFEFARKNVERNHLKNAEILHGDVREVVPRIQDW